MNNNLLPSLFSKLELGLESEIVITGMFINTFISMKMRYGFDRNKFCLIGLKMDCPALADTDNLVEHSPVHQKVIDSVPVRPHARVACSILEEAADPCFTLTLMILFLPLPSFLSKLLIMILYRWIHIIINLSKPIMYNTNSESLR